MPRRATYLALIAFGLLVILGSALPADAVVSSAGRHQTQTINLLRMAKVICETRKEGKDTVTYSCQHGNTCVSAGTQWKCRSAAAALPMSCAVCASNQKRDADACTAGGDLIQQNQCINRVNADYLKCIPGCR